MKPTNLFKNLFLIPVANWRLFKPRPKPTKPFFFSCHRSTDKHTIMRWRWLYLRHAHNNFPAFFSLPRPEIKSFNGVLWASIANSQPGRLFRQCARLVVLILSVTQNFTCLAGNDFQTDCKYARFVAIGNTVSHYCTVYRKKEVQEKSSKTWKRLYAFLHCPMNEKSRMEKKAKIKILAGRKERENLSLFFCWIHPWRVWKINACFPPPSPLLGLGRRRWWCWSSTVTRRASKKRRGGREEWVPDIAATSPSPLFICPVLK